MAHRAPVRPASGQLETMAQIGNYDWKLRFTLETGLGGNK
jgi:hypothetical protein